MTRFSHHPSWGCNILSDEINRRKTEKQWTYLHMFSSQGNSVMVNALLDFNADANICDQSGNNFLHVAFNYILESFDRGFLSYVCENVLTRVSSSLMEGRNRYRETPIDLLDEIVDVLQNKQAFQFVELENESENEVDEVNWNEKLFFEMAQEESFQYEGFGQDEFNDTYKKTKSESFTEWGDRIWKEYNRKRKSVESKMVPQQQKRKRRGPEEKSGRSRAAKDSSGMPPTDHLKELRTNMLLLKRREKYEESCHRLFKDPKATTKLRMDDLPWSHFPRNISEIFDEQAILSSMLETFSYGFTDEEKIKYFKVQRIRWHPDKFLQKCGHRLQESDKEQILKLVNSISQNINSTLTSLEQVAD